ncbi:oligosaccharide flippase family protein [Anditalea andensis]|uniref:Polysaccharide biosynthesis protein n=1 Tax=Anditalea andensis TaxID=1048983 RepID=A0A074KXN3_9BACT|nr:polysaccharide biosynthesis C-terminal domain-containing protein [Anditalea andensis]KEO72373.1 polysaccharide biosynthesis protein [Anditalea andensis]
MGKVATQSILTTISSYLGVLIGYINILWLLPYALSPQQMGTFRTIQDMALLLVPFAQLGLGHGITRFFPQIKEYKFTFFTYTLILSFIGFGIVAFCFILFQDAIVKAYAANSPDIITYLGIVLLITFLAVLNSVFESFARSFLKIAIPTFIREVLLRLLITGLILSYIMEWLHFDQIMWGLGGIYFITLATIIAYLLYLKMFSLNFSFGSLSSGFRSSFLRFSLITFLGTAGSILIMKIDSLMVAAMISLDANAIYTIAFSIAVVIEMPRRAISQVVMPIIAEKFAENKLDEINQLYKKVAVNQLLICLLLFIGIWINIDNLYYYVPNKDIYEAGKWVVLIIGLGKLSDILFSINGEIIVFSKFYTFNITATLAMSVVVILLNIVLIPPFGIEGAALASLVAMVLYNIIKYLYIKVKLKFSPFSPALFKILLIGVVVVGFSQILIPSFQLVLLDIVFRSVIVTILYGGAIYIFGLAPEVTGMIEDRFKKSAS